MNIEYIGRYNRNLMLYSIQLHSRVCFEIVSILPRFRSVFSNEIRNVRNPKVANSPTQPVRGTLMSFKAMMLLWKN